jgi:fumarate hydratase subunit alpha
MKEKILELVKKAVVDLPEEVEEALREAYKGEKNEIARLQLKTILENVKLARQRKCPLCQDTGLPIFFVDLGKNANREEVERAIREGVKEATENIPLRPNVVNPISRENPGTNLGEGIPHIYWNPGGDHTEVVYLPKGAGAENASAQKMLKPAEGLEGLKNFILETVKRAGGKSCPPIIIGVGIGGSFDLSVLLAKKALLRPLKSYNPREDIARLEKELLEEVNKLGIGPMGLGGSTTALKVNIEYASCHTASLPVAINIQCWAHRYARGRI